MRRSVIFGLMVLGITTSGWWFWSSRQAPANPETTSITAAKNFSNLHGPISPNEEHRYRIRLWENQSPVDVPTGSSNNMLLEKLPGRAIMIGRLGGRYGAEG